MTYDIYSVIETLPSSVHPIVHSTSTGPSLHSVLTELKAHGIEAEGKTYEVSIILYLILFFSRSIIVYFNHINNTYYFYIEHRDQ